MTEPDRPEDVPPGDAEHHDAERLAGWLDGSRSDKPAPRDAEIPGLFTQLRGEEHIPPGAWARIAADPARIPRRARAWPAMLALAAALVLAAGVMLWSPGSKLAVPGPTIAELELAQGALADRRAAPSERLATMARAADAGRARILRGLPGGY